MRGTMDPEPISSVSNDGAPEEADIRAELKRIQGADLFLRAARMSALLGFLVEETLSGRAAQLKAFTVAQGVFGRDETFDPQNDTIVRVEASRLRRQLKSYYDGVGKNDPVIIGIPRGTYRPSFKRKDDDPVAAPEASRPAPVVSLRPEEKPFIAIMPLGLVPENDLSSSLAAGYIDAVVAALARLPGLSVMASRSAAAAMRNRIPLEELRDRHGVTHMIDGTFATQRKKIRITVQLVDTATESVMWSEWFDGDSDKLFELEASLANRIGTVLSATVDADVTKRIYLRHTSNGEALDLFRRALIAVNPPFERARVQSAHGIYEYITELDPEFAGGFAGLSQCCCYMHLFEHSESTARELDEAVAYADKAIALDDTFGMGYTMLGFAKALGGDLEGGLSHARYAVELEPGDPLGHQLMAAILIFSGHSEFAIEPLREAVRLDPIEPREPFLSLLGIAHFNLGRYAEALEPFESLVYDVGVRSPNMESYRAATYIALNRIDDARAVIETLNEVVPAIPYDRWIGRWTRGGDLSSRTLDQLRELGLSMTGADAAG